MTRAQSFGRIEVRPDQRRVLVGGEQVTLGARAFDLLLALIEHRDRVVGKDELMAMVWPGMVVEEGNLTVHVSALRKVFGADAISTVAGRGYRFTLSPDEPMPTVVPAPEAATPTEVSLPLPDKPSIVVLPFANLSADPEQSYFADGVTDDITTELSRFRSLFVTSRNSAFTYRGKAIDIRQIGRELGVRYVVEGSVRRAGARVRVTAQLIDATSDTHLWAEKYDRVLEDIFEVQEEVTRCIVTAIAPEIEAADLERIGFIRPEDVGAYHLGVRAYSCYLDALSKSDHRAHESSVEMAQRALAMDPRCVPALTALACAQFWAVFYGTATDRDVALQQGVDIVTAAISIDRADVRPYVWRAMLRVFSYDERVKRDGLEDARQAHALNPNDAMSLIALGFCEAVCGDPITAHGPLLAVLRLSPRDPWRWNIHNSLGMACFQAKDYRQGLDWSLRSCSERPDFPSSRLHAALNCVGCGLIAQASAEMNALRRIAPAMFDRIAIHEVSVFAEPEQRHRAVVFARIAAGLEDPSAADSLR